MSRPVPDAQLWCVGVGRCTGLVRKRSGWLHICSLRFFFVAYPDGVWRWVNTNVFQMIFQNISFHIPLSGRLRRVISHLSKWPSRPDQDLGAGRLGAPSPASWRWCRSLVTVVHHCKRCSVTCQGKQWLQGGPSLSRVCTLCAIYKQIVLITNKEPEAQGA